MGALLPGIIPLLLRAAPPAGMGFYEEDVLASSPIRVEQWKQMQAYVDALSGTVARPRAAEAKVPEDSVEVLRQALRDSLGYPPPGFLKQPSARFEKIGEDRIATYFRCYVQVTPQMETYGLYLVPKHARLPAPLVVALHGGGGFPESAIFHSGANYHDLIRGAAEEGYVVFAPLTVMYPYHDRDHGTPIPADVRERLDAQLQTHGLRLMGVEVAKISRALDAVLKRPEIDPNRIAMLGLSYGGFYTLYATALDPRIRVAVASCSIRDRIDPAKRNELDIFSSADLVELISPRPLQLQDGISDPLFPIDDVRRAVAKARLQYPGPLADKFDFEEFVGGHEFHGAAAWPFLRKYLGPR